MLTLTYFTRTCGPLSLCGPTTVGLVRNGEIFKKFSRNISSQKTHDFDMVRLLHLRYPRSHTKLKSDSFGKKSDNCLPHL